MAQPYSPPKLDQRIRVAVDAGEFDFLLPYAKALYRTEEGAETLGREQQFVRNLVAAGRLEAHTDNALGMGLRKTSLVTRRSLLLYLAETANYSPNYLVVRIEALMKTLNPAALDRLIDTARKLKERL